METIAVNILGILVAFLVIAGSAGLFALASIKNQKSAKGSQKRREVCAGCMLSDMCSGKESCEAQGNADEQAG